jgi:putative RecB family exonuclease
LIYLGNEPQIITATPSEQSARGLSTKVSAIWQAVERACEKEDFRPKRSALCDWCSFQSYCPEFGGDPAEATALGEQLRIQHEADRVAEQETEQAREATTA